MDFKKIDETCGCGARFFMPMARKVVALVSPHPAIDEEKLERVIEQSRWSGISRAARTSAVIARAVREYLEGGVK